jgi:hypothetical protein
LILPKLQPGPGHSVAQVLSPKSSMEPVIGSLISVMTCSKMDCWISKMTALMSKMTCHKSSILALPRLPLLTALMSKMTCNKSSIWVLPFLQPGQSVILVLSLKPIAAPQRLSAEAVRLDQGTRRPCRLRPPLRGQCKLWKLLVRRAREMRRFKRYRLPCKDKIKIMSALHKARSVAGQLVQKITLQERRSHRLASGNGLSDVVGYYIGSSNRIINTMYIGAGPRRHCTYTY